MARRAVLRPWAIVAFAAVWNVPWIVHAFVRIQLYPVYAALSAVLALIAALTWIVPGWRRRVYIPDASLLGGNAQVAGSVIALVMISSMFWFILPGIDPE